jgi:hypothetical protein
MKSKKPKTIKNKDALLVEKQIKEMQRDVDYDQRDFTIDYIVQQFRTGLFYIPPYQRNFVWREKNRRRFIESILLGLPIPFMFLAETDDGRLEIVDGAQRIQTLESFVNGDLILKDLEKLTKANGFEFNNLPISLQRKFNNRPLRIIILDDQTTVETRHEIFNRINTSGVRARPSEIRSGAFTGKFMRFIKSCADNPLFKELCPITKIMTDRREPEELIIRFFAYSDKYMEFRHDVYKFLDKFVEANKENFDKKRLEKEFKKMLHFVKNHFPYGFGKSKNAKTTPRVRFEAIAIGVNLALRENPDLVPKPTTAWLESKEFQNHTTTHASNSAPRLRGRVEFVKNSLSK